MPIQNTKALTLSAALWPQSFTRNATLAFIGTMLLAISAKVQVPLPLVPMTMQTFFVLVLSASFGMRLGVATVALYLFEGLAFYMPVFAADFAGPAYLLRPTMGYLISYLFAAGLVGFLAERGFDRTPLKALIMMSAGAALVLVMGSIWLCAMIGVDKAFSKGVVLFVVPDAIKAVLAAATLPLAWKLIRK